LIALPILLVFILKSSFFSFFCLSLGLTAAGLLEFYRMALPRRRYAGFAAAFAGSLLMPVVVFSFLPSLVPAVVFNCLPFSLCLTLLFLCIALLSLFSIRDIKQSAGEAGLFLLGFLYLPLLMSYLVLLRELDHGVKWIFLLLLIVMSGDTAAFYVGSSIGKRKLYPIVSPNKSVEGMVGGLGGSILGTLLAGATFFPELSIAGAVATAIFVGLLGQLGDLFESLLKRSFGVKDSGNIFPGHGGMLDRLDSVLFAAPSLYIYARYFF
jgi:phosphatidate cytidylyltransferase